MASTSRMTDSWLREVTMRPWWNASEQKLHPPKQPRLWMTLKRTSSIAGTPPSGSYIGCTSRVYGSAATASSSSVLSGMAGG